MPAAVRLFFISIYTHLHGSAAHIGNPSNQYQHIIQKCTCLELQIVNGGSGRIVSAVSAGSGTCHFIHPFQKLAAEQAPESVNIRIYYNTNLFGDRIRYFLSFHLIHHAFLSKSAHTPNTKYTQIHKNILVQRKEICKAGRKITKNYRDSESSRPSA